MISTLHHMTLLSLYIISQDIIIMHIISHVYIISHDIIITVHYIT